MTERVFDENLAKFAKICPRTAILLSYIEPSECQFCLTAQDELNLKKGSLYLHSKNGAIDEAAACLKPFLKADAEVIYVYGIGLGYAYFIAKEWLQQNRKRRIVFIEDDLEVLRVFLETERAADLLSNPQARLIAVEAENKIDGSEVFIECRLKKFYTAALPSYLENRKEVFQKVIQIIRTQLFLFSNRIKEALNHEQLAANFYMKLAKITDAKAMQGLADAFVNIPALIIGAGPSLEQDLPLLRELEDKAIFLGAGSAVNALNAKGIYTHFGAGLDPTPVQASRIKTNASFETPFFYTNRFSYEALEFIHGPKIFTPQDPEKPWCEWFEKQLGILNPHTIHSGFSTSNYCSSLALFLGCNPIVFLGIDMSYGEGKKYLSGIGEHPGDSDEVKESLQKRRSDSIPVMNYEGKWFDTNLMFVHESSWFTVKVLKNPNTTFYYGSEKGFGINHVPRKPLKSIAFNRQYDLLNHIHAAIELSENPVMKKDVAAAMQVWKKSLSRCLLALLKMLQICKRRLRLIKQSALQSVYSSEWILLETELEEEPAYQYLLKSVKEAAEIAEMSAAIKFRLKDNPSQQEEIRYQLQMFLNSYEKMIEVGNLHLQALKMALKRQSAAKGKGRENAQQENIYSFQDGELCILDPELKIDIREKFSPACIPSNLKDTPEWQSCMPVREAYAYRNKIMDGECLQYFTNGMIKARQYYQNNLLHGPSTFFNKNGKILAQSWFYKGKREGKTLRYFANGKLNAIERWRNGLRQGKQEYFYPHGGAKSAIDFQQGILNGKVVLFFPNGNLKFSSSYSKGKKKGNEEFYYLNGTKISQVEYDNNQPVGTAFFWHSNGQLAKRILFNRLGGFYMSEWDSKGKELVREQFFHQDNLMVEAEALKQSILELMDDKSKTIL